MRRPTGAVDAVEMVVCLDVRTSLQARCRMNLHPTSSAWLGVIILGSLGLVLPPETPVSKSKDMDWVGSFLAIAGFILFNFVWK